MVCHQDGDNESCETGTKISAGMWEGNVEERDNFLRRSESESEKVGLGRKDRTGCPNQVKKREKN